MSTITIKSYRDEIEGKITDNLQKALERVGALVERQAKINTTEPPSPQRRTGQLASSITHVVSPGQVEIGTNVVHGKYLELGTSRMVPYPWLFPAVELKRNEIIATLKGESL
uniref:Putative tail protein n=1 Tax=viral metagenome TaxID=1070528 RepID=A0A6M3KK60_9ZZZZ